MKTEQQINSHLTDQQKQIFRFWLQKQYSERSRKNPSYSLRAFAGLLKLDASTVSQILSGKRAPSKKSLMLICQKLSASPQDIKRLGLTDQQQNQNDFFQINEETFTAMSDWQHYAILELTFVKGFKSNPQWISQQLGISTVDAKSAIERLIQLGLLRNENGVLKKNSEAITNHLGINTNAAKKNLQKQIMNQALAAIDNIAQEEKDISSMTMAIDPKNLDAARELIKKFRRDLCQYMETGTQSQVYHLAIQLFPITKDTKGNL